MHWRIYNNQLPLNGVECVVGRPHKDGHPSFGIYAFYHSDKCWYGKGKIIECLPQDHWCPVSEIIHRVEEIFKYIKRNYKRLINSL